MSGFSCRQGQWRRRDLVAAGGGSTKIHFEDRFVRHADTLVTLTGGEASDSRNFETLLDMAPISNRGPRSVTMTTIPSQTARPHATSEYAQQSRIDPTLMACPPSKSTLQNAGRIEQAVGKFKRFKRIALRCKKTAQNYGSFVALALGFILIKSVHTA